MIGESFAIIAVILAMAAMLAKSGRQIFAMYALPFCSIPAVHLIGAALRLREWLYAFDIAGALFGVLFCFLLSRPLRLRRARVIYLFLCCVFMAALLLAYLLTYA